MHELTAIYTLHNAWNRQPDGFAAIGFPLVYWLGLNPLGLTQEDI